MLKIELRLGAAAAFLVGETEEEGNQHNSGIFTISLNKHLRLLNFVIIIKCSRIIVHEFP